jgi:hypothetical protein
VRRVRAAREENSSFETAAADFTLDFLNVRIRSSVCRNSMEAVTYPAGSSIVAENNWWRERIAGAHRRRILLDDLPGGPGDPLLDGCVDRDLGQWNAAQFRRRLNFGNRVHWSTRSITRLAALNRAT